MSKVVEYPKIVVKGEHEEKNLKTIRNGNADHQEIKLMRALCSVYQEVESEMI